MDTDDLDRPVIKYIMIIEFVLTNIYREKIKKILSEHKMYFGKCCN